MKRDPKNMPDWQFIVRLGCNFITATLLAAIVMGGFVLLCEKTEPTSVAPAQSDTVFDRGARYDFAAPAFEPDAGLGSVMFMRLR